jgi:hypothetical protein
MSPRQIRVYRESERFMPGLFAFAYPVSGRRYRRWRLIALRAWAFAFQVRVRLSDL